MASAEQHQDGQENEKGKCGAALGENQGINSVDLMEAGKAADLIVVGADPSKDVANLRRLRFVMRAGVLHPVEELKAVAASR